MYLTSNFFNNNKCHAIHLCLCSKTGHHSPLIWASGYWLAMSLKICVWHIPVWCSCLQWQPQDGAPWLHQHDQCQAVRHHCCPRPRLPQYWSGLRCVQSPQRCRPQTGQPGPSPAAACCGSCLELLAALWAGLRTKQHIQVHLTHLKAHDCQRWQKIVYTYSLI